MFHYIILNSPVMWLMLSLTNKSVNIHSMSCFHTHIQWWWMVTKCMFQGSGAGMSEHDHIYLSVLCL